MAKLVFEAVFKLTLGILLVGVAVFLPAGTLSFPNGWLFMIILFALIFLMGIIMIIKSPELLKKRLNGKEKMKDQSLFVKLVGIMFISGFVLSGLGFRFGWYTLPPGFSVFGAVIFLLSYAMYAEVMRENAYLNRTIKVEEGQRLIDKGLYGIVRHPMYSASVLLFLAMPLILGSLYAFFVLLLYPILIAFRILSEERLLEKELDGYKEYKTRVKYRLIPFVW